MGASFWSGSAAQVIDAHLARERTISSPYEGINEIERLVIARAHK
ncbi:MAG: hypothetical protein ACHQC8_00515 [Solirubrobacterales bacterium]